MAAQRLDWVRAAIDGPDGHIYVMGLYRIDRFTSITVERLMAYPPTAASHVVPNPSAAVSINLEEDCLSESNRSVSFHES
jgi:hypothetical protein